MRDYEALVQNAIRAQAAGQLGDLLPDRWQAARQAKVASLAAIRDRDHKPSSGVGFLTFGPTAQAIETARRQQSKAWELRATMSFARLWDRQGLRDQARAALREQKYDEAYQEWVKDLRTKAFVEVREWLD